MYCQQQNIIHPLINSVFISSELSTELSNSYFFYLIFCESLLQLDGVQTSFWKRRKGPSLNTTSWICLQLQSSSYCSSEDNLRHISSIFPRRSFSFTTRMYGTGLYSQQLVQLTKISQMYKQDHILPVNEQIFINCLLTIDRIQTQNKNGVLWSQTRMRIEMTLRCFLVIQ